MSGDLLDTSILIAPDPASLSELPAAAAISVITLGVLRAGVLLARDERSLTARSIRFDAVRAAFLPLPVDEPVAERTARSARSRAHNATPPRQPIS